jgi:Flp pilus assembly CpaF family ATPase
LCFVRDPEARPVSAGALAALRRLAETPWERLHILDLGPLQREIARLLWRFIDYRREGPLKAREFLELVCGESEEGEVARDPTQ